MNGKAEPARVALQHLRRGKRLTLEAFKTAENTNRLIAASITRTKEVAAFSAESGGKMAEDAMSNATALLSHEMAQISSPEKMVEANLLKAQATFFLQIHLALEQSRWEELKYSWRKQSRQAVTQTPGVLLHALRRSVRAASRSGHAMAEWALIKLNWSAAPAHKVNPVAELTRFGKALKHKHGAAQMPVLYRHLFGLEPVQNPRFLVGREQERDSLVHSERAWRDGQGAAVLVVGDRGSGKTSLLNCAITSFEEKELRRGQFSERISEPAKLKEFLHNLLGACPRQPAWKKLCAIKDGLSSSRNWNGHTCASPEVLMLSRN